MKGLSTQPRRVFMLGGTGTIGRATVSALAQRGHDVMCFVRPGRGASVLANTSDELRPRIEVRSGDVTDVGSLQRDGFRGERFDVVVSCLASRTGLPDDAWRIDHGAHVATLQSAQEAGVSQMILLSAICVQKPRLAFQHAKLAFEEKLIRSGLTYSIVRPTAFFKSLSGQIERVRSGKPFLLFGDGTSTSCKPISDRDLANYIASCLDRDELRNRILPIGGPGEAISPRQQAMQLFAMLGREPRVRQVPLALLNTIVFLCATAGKVSAAAARKAELARIGHYYATESMLVLDEATGRYDAAATPSFGQDTLFDFYRDVLAGTASVDRGDHAVF